MEDVKSDSRPDWKKLLEEIATIKAAVVNKNEQQQFEKNREARPDYEILLEKIANIKDSLEESKEGLKKFTEYLADGNVDPGLVDWEVEKETFLEDIGSINNSVYEALTTVEETKDIIEKAHVMTELDKLKTRNNDLEKRNKDLERRNTDLHQLLVRATST